MDAEIARRLSLQAQGKMLPFTIFNQATGQSIGMTTYMNIDAANRHVEIGSTWTRKSSQRFRHQHRMQIAAPYPRF